MIGVRCIALALSLWSVGAALADTLPINQLPMYGRQEKNEAMKAADAAFLADVEKRGLTRQEAAKQMVQTGWGYWKRKDAATAIKRFNQAWLLDPDNGNAYHGFAVVTADRGAAPTEVEDLFLQAVSKANVDTAAWVDYGRFLWTQWRLEESLTTLQKALALSPTARDARSHIAFVYYLQKDFGNACRWAQQAKANGEGLETGFLEDMCAASGAH